MKNKTKTVTITFEVNFDHSDDEFYINTIEYNGINALFDLPDNLFDDIKSKLLEELK